MKTQRNRYSAEFKAKLALEVVKGERTLNRDRQRRPGSSEPLDAMEEATARKLARCLRRQTGQGKQGARREGSPTLPADRTTQGRTGLDEKKSGQALLIRSGL